MDVGVRELKQNLSTWLDRAAQGEVITVTDRGVPKAVIMPLPGIGHYQRGIEEGWIRPPLAAALTPTPRAAARRSTLRVLGEDRNG